MNREAWPFVVTLAALACMAGGRTHAAEPTLVVDPPAVEQGKTLVVLVTAPDLTEPPTVRFLDREPPCLPHQSGYRALIGIPVDAAPGEHLLEVRVGARPLAASASPVRS